MSREEFDAVLADKDAEIKRLRRRMEALTCPCPNMADLEDIASERDALAKKVKVLERVNAEQTVAVEELRRLLTRHRTIFLGTVGFGAIVSDIDSALAATEPTSAAALQEPNRETL